ncbi:MAG: protein-L-isoaspartate(D-aspartate) O-methyltransferase [Gammaproteobacteria bacterium]|nr:protein-L-isoaspartate(D-aspartate) O-methyltransferase [Gammaproteobacteria bacterium]
MTSQRTRERLMKRLEEQGISDVALLHAMRSIPRHIFVDEALASRAYEDTALPIGQGQTISQPYIVARMTQALLEGGTPQRVLEIGTGCGYQTAILACLVGEVYSIERIASLLTETRRRLGELKLRNIHLKHGDGYLGWPQHAAYDGILITAAAAEIPPLLLEQLAEGGRLIAPVGPAGAQDLIRLTRTREGYTREVLERASFVPLLGGAA